MIEKKWRISLSIALVGLFCLVGCAGPGPAQSLSTEPDMLSLAEVVMDESDLLALAEGATEQSDLLTLAENATQESPLRFGRAQSSTIREGSAKTGQDDRARSDC